MKRLAVPLILAMLAGACARSEDATMTAAESNESHTIAERVRPSNDEQEPALGEWRRTLQDTVSALEFGPSGTSALLSFVCGPNGGLVLQRHGAVANGPSPSITLAIGGQTRQLPVTAVSGTTPSLRSEIPAGNRVIAELIGAQAPIALRSGDSTPLIVPASAMIGEFVQSCTGSPATPAPGTPAPGTPVPGEAAGQNQAAESNVITSTAPAR